MFTLSVILVFFSTDKSKFLKSGPTTLLRPTLPKALPGRVYAPVGFTNQFPSGLLVNCTGPAAFGRTVAIPVMVLEAVTIFRGLPLCKLTIGAIDQPSTKKRFPLKGRS